MIAFATAVQSGPSPFVAREIPVSLAFKAAPRKCKQTSIPLALLLFVAFFLVLILTKTPMNLSLIGSGVATLIAGSYLGLSIMGKPFRAISTNIDKLTDIKRVGYFVGLLEVNPNLRVTYQTLFASILKHITTLYETTSNNNFSNLCDNSPLCTETS